MTRPVVLGVVGDSAAGKTTLTRGVIRILGGPDHVSYLSGDDYHRYGRQQRAELDVTPLDPSANHLDILGQHLRHIRAGEPILKPVYDHRTGSLKPSVLVRPQPYVVVEALLGYHSEELRAAHDIRVFLAPPEELRRTWKLTRDCTRRGYTTHEVLSELDRRERDVESYVRPQRRHADILVSFRPTASNDRSVSMRTSSCATRSGTRTCRPSCGRTATARPSFAGSMNRCCGFPAAPTPCSRRSSRRPSGSGCSTRATYAFSDSASSRSGPSCTARSRSHWRRRCSCITSSRRGPRSAPGLILKIGRA